MTSWRWILFGLCGLWITGCQVDPRLALLEQECRQLEDRLYLQQATLDQYQDSLERCQRAKGPALGDSTRERNVDGPLRKLLAPENQPTNEPSKVPASAVIEPPNVELPKVEIIDTPDPIPTPENVDPPNILPDVEPGEAPPWNPGTTGSPHSRQIARIALIDQLTGGHNLDHRPGDEGLSVGLQPLTDQGKLVKLAAPVSVVVLDPSLSGEAARVGRWDFTAQEVAASIRPHELGETIYLEMVWPKDPPNHRQLRLDVRYTTAEKRHLDTRRYIEINVPGRSLAELKGDSPQPSKRPLAKSPEFKHLAPIRVADRPEIPSSHRPKKTIPQRPVWSPNRS